MPRRPDTDDLRRTMQGLLSRAVDVVGEVKDVMVRSSQVGRIRLDAARAQVEKNRLLWELGGQVVKREIELPPDLQELVDRVAELDRDVAGRGEAEQRVRDEAQAMRETTHAAARSRPDDFGEEDETSDDDLE